MNYLNQMDQKTVEALKKLVSGEASPTRTEKLSLDLPESSWAFFRLLQEAHKEKRSDVTLAEAIANFLTLSIEKMLTEIAQQYQKKDLEWQQAKKI